MKYNIVFRSNFIFLVFFVFSNAFASLYDDFVSKIVPQSPQTAQLLKFGTYPVSHSSGLVQIDIPIYEINYDGVSVPISISYHSSGIKVDEVASVVGLGWSLNAGGVIGRSIMGSEDCLNQLPKWHNNNKRFYYNSADDVERSINLLYKCDIKTNEGDWLADQVCETLSGMGGNEHYDSQSDKYMYQFGNHSGSFRYEVSQDTIVLCPYKPLKITWNNIAPFGFKVIDENGIVYFFSEEDVSWSSTISDCHLIGTSFSNQYSTATTGWYLSYLVTPVKKDTIFFEYSKERHTGLVVTPSGFCHEGNFYEVGNHAEYGPSWSFRPIHCYDNILHNNTFSTPVLQKISWAGNSVEFFYDKDRPEKQCKLSQLLQLLRLNRIQVYNSKGDIVRNVVFNKEQLGHGDYDRRLLLSDVSMYGKDEKEAEKYQFEYNTNVTLPDYTIENGKKGIYCTCDYWGYYNGQQGTVCIPQLVLDKGTNRNPNYFLCQAGMLKSITYPTGGVTQFVYEGNENETGENLGGLRIKEITNLIDGKITNREVYSYLASDYYKSMERYELFEYSTDYIFQSVSVINGAGMSSLSSISENTRCYSSEPCSPMSAFFGNSPFYKKVIKEVYDGSGEKVACTEYEYEPDHYLIPRNDIAGDSYADLEPRFYSEEKNYDYGTVTPLLVKQVDYKYENGHKQLESSIENTYELVNTGIEPIVGVTVNSDFTPVVYDYPSTIHRWHPFYSPAEYAGNIYAFNVYAVPHYKRLATSTVKEHGITTLSTYAYDPSYRTLQPLSVTTSRTGCAPLEKRYVYPFLSNDSIFKQMHSDNYVDLVIGESSYVNGIVASNAADIYIQENGKYLLSKKQYSIGANPLETRVDILQYDSHGNIFEMRRDDGTLVFILWGYCAQYPIMKIECPILFSIGCLNFLKPKIDKLANSVVPDGNTINAIRTYVESHGGLVTSYKYKPLVGVTEIIDERGIKTSYSYDSMNRLSVIYDSNGDVKECYKYNYQNK